VFFGARVEMLKLCFIIYNMSKRDAYIPFRKKYNAKTFKERADEYFNGNSIEDWTVSGFLLHMDISKDYFKECLNSENKALRATAEWAFVNLENAYEKAMRGKGRTADVFALKNFGWSDKQDLSIQTKGAIKISFDDAFKGK